MTSALVEPLARRGFEEWLAKRAPLTDRDLEKWHDFLADSEPGRCSGPSLLASIFHLFKRVFGAGAIGAPALPTRSVGFSINMLRAEADHFDRLAGHYGDLYRGSVIVNYALGLLAVWFALVPVIFGIEKLWMLKACVGVEVILLVAMLGLFLHGRSPHLESAGTTSVGGGRWFNQR